MDLKNIDSCFEKDHLLIKLTKMNYLKNKMKSNKGNFDAIIIGSGIGGLVTASQLAAKGAQVLVLEKYIIPGGSGGHLNEKAILLT